MSGVDNHKQLLLLVIGHRKGSKTYDKMPSFQYSFSLVNCLNRSTEMRWIFFPTGPATLTGYLAIGVLGVFEPPPILAICSSYDGFDKEDGVEEGR